MLNFMYILMLRQEKVFLIIEEAEAHIYPSLQKKDAEYYRGGWDDSMWETLIGRVAENGEQVTIPQGFEGYKTVTWLARPAAADTSTFGRSILLEKETQQQAE